MSNIKLDLKQFKHVSSDDKSTTLQHKDGHSLTLAHKGLSKDNQVQLKALAAMSKDSMKASDKGQMKQEQQARDPNSVPKYAFGDIVDKAAKYLDSIADDQYSKDKKSDPPSTMKPAGVPPGRAPATATPPVRQDGYAEGGEVQKFEGGGDVQDMDPESPAEVPEALQPNPPTNPIDEATNTIHNDPRTMRGANPQLEYENSKQHLQSIADDPATQMESGYTPSEEIVNQGALNSVALDHDKAQGNSAAIADAEAKKQQFASEASKYGIKTGTAPQAAGMPQAQMPEASTPRDPQHTGPAENLDDTEKMMKAGYAAKMGGIKAEADAKAALGAAQSQAIEKSVKDQQDAMVSYKQHYDDLEKERQAHIADIKAGYIDPDKYWTGDKDGNGSHSRIAAGIGMILAGFNPTDKPNAAIDFLKHQMDANLDAQKQNLNSKQNLLAENLKQFGNLKDATAMTKVMQSDILANKLQQAAATAANPMAKAEAMKAIGQLQLEAAPVMQQFAIRRAMLGLANGQNGNDPSNTGPQEQMISYLRMTNPEMAKEMESRLLPGIGMAKIPLTPAVREQIVSHQKLQDSAQDLMTYSKNHSNVLPGTPEYNFGVTKAMAFQQMVREGLLGTVFRESEKPLLEKFVNENPAGAMKAFTTQPQLKAIMASNLMGLNAIKQSNGLPVKAAPMEAHPMEGKTATNAQGQKIIMTNGKWIPAR